MKSPHFVLTMQPDLLPRADSDCDQSESDPEDPDEDEEGHDQERAKMDSDSGDSDFEMTQHIWDLVDGADRNHFEAENASIFHAR